MTETISHEVIELSLERKIETELVKHNVTDAVINALRTKYGSMKLKALDDKESYLEIKAAAKECAKVRTLAVSVCKKGREDAVKVQKQWVAKEKEVVGKIAEVEGGLDTEIEKYNDEVERKENEAKRLQEEGYIRRTQTLTKMGCVYDNNEFSIGEVSIEAMLVKESSDIVWEESMLPKFISEYQKVEAKRIEAERIAAEKAAAIQKEREDLERQQREFKAQQEAFRIEKEEANRIEREKKEAEDREIIQKRAELQNNRLRELVAYNQDDMFPSTLWLLSEMEFSALVAREKEKAAQKQKEKEDRIAQRERDRIAEEQRQAEIKRQQEEARKQEEMAKASDIVKFNDLMEKIKWIQLPEMRSGQYRKKVAIIREKLEEIKQL